MTTLTPNRIAALPRVNLLPPEIAAAERLRQLKVLLGVLVLGALGAVVLLFLFVSGQVGGAQDDLSAAQAEGAQLQSQVDTYAEVPQVLGELDAAQVNLSTAMQPEIRWSFYLNDLSLTIPKTSRLESLTAVNDAAAAQMAASTGLVTEPVTPLGQPTMGSITFTGRSTDFDAVAAWLQSLGSNPGMTEPSVQNVQRPDGGNTVGTFYDVDSKVQLTPEAASNRYQQIDAGE